MFRQSFPHLLQFTSWEEAAGCDTVKETGCGDKCWHTVQVTPYGTVLTLHTSCWAWNLSFKLLE